jgi:hydrogenase-4 component B
MAALAGLRAMLLSNRAVSTSLTWDCGYAQPTSKMQYTASSYTQAQADFYLPVVPVEEDIKKPVGLFPLPGHFRQAVPDAFLKYGYTSLFRTLHRLLARLSWLQQGQVNIYVLYIAVTLFGLLIWYLRNAL